MDTPHEQAAGEEARAKAPVRPPQQAEAGSPLRVYKPGQGQSVRWGSAVGAGVMAVAAALYMREQLRAYATDSELLRVLGPVALLLGLAWLVFYLVGRHHGVVDFMIATEGEMKKVNWTSRREVMGATRVVIVTVLSLSLLLFVVDIFFMFVFSAIGVLKVDVWQIFGGGGG